VERVCQWAWKTKNQQQNSGRIITVDAAEEQVVLGKHCINSTPIAAVFKSAQAPKRGKLCERL